MRIRHALSAVFALAVAGAACNGTTGDALISFVPYASGAPGAGKPFAFDGYAVQILYATMYVGAVYFDESPPSTGFDEPVCNTSDIYAAQVPGDVLVNLLSTDPQEFSVYGTGSADVALSWDIWLTSGDVNQPNVTPIIELTGKAASLTDPTRIYSFGAIVSINPGESGAGARGGEPTNPALPGQYPICKDRILQLGGLDLQFYQGGTLNVQIDPRGWFSATTGIDFPNLAPVSSSNCNLDANSTEVYEAQGACDASGGCPSGMTCNTANNSCVEACGASQGVCSRTGGCPAGLACDTSSNVCRAPCSNGFVCNPNGDGNCVAAVCIPDTNYATSSASPEAAEAGEAFYLGILGGGPAAYSVSYTGQSNNSYDSP